MKRRCPKCGEEWDIKGPVGFREECPECAAFIHTCTNCAHYEPGARGCLILTTDPVHDRQGVNFCEEFEFNTGEPPVGGKGPGPARTAQAGQPKLSAEEARRKFENLFRDPKK
jgi:hypothetical protein